VNAVGTAAIKCSSFSGENGLLALDRMNNIMDFDSL
jgi:hypothetical protein